MVDAFHKRLCFYKYPYRSPHYGELVSGAADYIMIVGESSEVGECGAFYEGVLKHSFLRYAISDCLQHAKAHMSVL